MDMDREHDMDTSELGIGRVERKIEDEVKNEPSEIDIFRKCGIYWNSSSSRETDNVDHDHNYAKNIFQEGDQRQIEETLEANNLNLKDQGHSTIFESLSSTCITVPIKKEDFDIFYEDIKRETGDEKSSEHSRFCMVCYKSFGAETDFKSTSYRSKCTCQNQNNDFNLAFQIDAVKNEPSEIDIFTKCERCRISSSSETDYVDHDHSYASHSCQECGQEQIEEKLEAKNLNPKDLDSRLKPLEVKEETIFGNEVTKEQGSSAVPRRLSVPPTENGNKTELIFCSNPLETNLSIAKTKNQCRSFSKSFTIYMKNEQDHTGKKPFHCKLCSESFKLADSLKIHERRHTGKKPFCSKSFSRIGNLKTHERGHSDEKPFHCKVCSRSFSRIGNLKTHVRSHTGEKPFYCEICSKSFRRSDGLKVHERLHNGEKPFHCKICSETFRHWGSLKIHERRSHTGETPFHCKICSKSFNQMCNLKVHERCHTGEKPFHCKICSKSFNQMYNLKVHKRCHTGEKPLNCKICSESFRYAVSLKTHEMSHTGELPFSCKICLKSFKQMCNLKVHERGHTGEKPFSCKICLKSFKQMCNLKVHERSHTGELQFSCKICLKSFKQMCNLKVHERGHTGEKPFHCKICSKSFSRKDYLKVHVMGHTGENHFVAKFVPRLLLNLVI